MYVAGCVLRTSCYACMMLIHHRSEYAGLYGSRLHLALLTSFANACYLSVCIKLHCQRTMDVCTMGACSFGYSRDDRRYTHRPSFATKPTPTKPVTPEPLSKPSPEPSPTRKLVCCRALPQLLEPRSHVTGVPELRDDTPVVNVSLSHAGSAPLGPGPGGLEDDPSGARRPRPQWWHRPALYRHLVLERYLSRNVWVYRKII